MPPGEPHTWERMRRKEGVLAKQSGLIFIMTSWAGRRRDLGCGCHYARRKMLQGPPRPQGGASGVWGLWFPGAQAGGGGGYESSLSVPVLDMLQYSRRSWCLPSSSRFPFILGSSKMHVHVSLGPCARGPLTLPFFMLLFFLSLFLLTFTLLENIFVVRLLTFIKEAPLTFPLLLFRCFDCSDPAFAML